MKGHVTTCGCVACKTISRINQLLLENSGNPGFIQFAGDRLRVAESELRDELSRYQVPAGPGASQGSPTPIRASGVAATGVPPKAQALWPTLSGAPHLVLPHQAAPLPPPPAPLKDPLPPPPGVPGLSPKLQGPQASAPNSNLVKAEPSPEQESKEPVQEVADQESGLPSKEFEKRSTPKKRKSRSPSSRGKDRSRKEKRHTPDRAPRREHKRREPTSPREEEEEFRGKEKKYREEGGEAHPASSGSRVPREPSYPPPRTGSKPQGKGWQGELPVSNHPRWSQRRDKGLVKVAKQELWHRRKHYRR